MYPIQHLWSAPFLTENGTTASETLVFCRRSQLMMLLFRLSAPGLLSVGDLDIVSEQNRLLSVFKMSNTPIVWRSACATQDTFSHHIVADKTNILHITGHEMETGLALERDPKKSAQNELGKMLLCTPESLRGFLSARRPPRLVFCSASQSEPMGRVFVQVACLYHTHQRILVGPLMSKRSKTSAPLLGRCPACYRDRQERPGAPYSSQNRPPHHHHHQHHLRR